MGSGEWLSQGPTGQGAGRHRGEERPHGWNKPLALAALSGTVT